MEIKYIYRNHTRVQKMKNFSIYYYDNYIKIETKILSEKEIIDILSLKNKVEKYEREGDIFRVENYDWKKWSENVFVEITDANINSGEIQMSGHYEFYYYNLYKDISKNPFLYDRSFIIQSYRNHNLKHVRKYKMNNILIEKLSEILVIKLKFRFEDLLEGVECLFMYCQMPDKNRCIYIKTDIEGQYTDVSTYEKSETIDFLRNSKKKDIEINIKWKSLNFLLYDTLILFPENNDVPLEHAFERTLKDAIYK
jgi:hypothetical protein